MPNLAWLSGSLASILKNAVAAGLLHRQRCYRGTQRIFSSGRHRAYQISTSAALVQGVSAGAVSSRRLLANGDFGLGTFEHLDGEMWCLTESSIRCATTARWRLGRTIFRFRSRLSADFSR